MKSVEDEITPLLPPCERPASKEHRADGPGPQFVPKSGWDKQGWLAAFPRSFAIEFDGRGGCRAQDWDLCKKTEAQGAFTWHHLVLPRSNLRLGQALVEVLDPLKLTDILPLISSGPFCGVRNGCVMFRINSVGSLHNKYTAKLSAMITDNTILSFALGDVPRLGLDLEAEPVGLGASEKQSRAMQGDVLDFLLSMSHPEDVEDQQIPESISKLVIHILRCHVDHMRDLVTSFEVEVDGLERNLDASDVWKKKLLEDRRFSKMHLDLQKMLQVTTYGEETLPVIQEKLSGRGLCCAESDIADFQRLKKSSHYRQAKIAMILSRLQSLQGSLSNWQDGQINKRLYYLSVATVVFLPLSVITGAFGMNVSGVPWVPNTPGPGFRNVVIMSAALVTCLVLCFVWRPVVLHMRKVQQQTKARKRWRQASGLALFKSRSENGRAT